MPFPTTQWTRLAEATLNNNTAGREALDALCREYRAPVVAFLLSRGYDSHEAEDLAQELFLHLIESHALRRADRARGRFRTFILGVLAHLTSSARERECTQKRGGGERLASLDALSNDGFELTDPSSSAALQFDREWAWQLVTQAIAQLEREYATEGKADEFELLRSFLPGAAEPPPYEEASARTGQPAATIRTNVRRLREAFRRKLRAAVARTVGGPREIDGEIAHLRAALANRGSQCGAENLQRSAAIPEDVQ